MPWTSKHGRLLRPIEPNNARLVQMLGVLVPKWRYRRSGHFRISVLARPGRGHRRRWFSVEIQSLRLPVGSPSPFEFLDFIPRDDTEPAKCHDHRPDAHIGFGGWTNMPALRTSDHGSADVSGPADVMQHGIELIPQGDHLGEGKGRTPPPTEFRDHLRKPGPLRVARLHFRLIVPPNPFPKSPAILQ
jgi:hypothetical protein